MGAGCRVLRIPWTAKSTNESILSELKIQTHLFKIMRQRFKIMRKGGEKNNGPIVGNVEGNRSRDRSPAR